MVFDLGSDYDSQWAAINSTATKTAEALSKWDRKAEVDTGRRNGITSDERARIKDPGA